MTSGVFISIIVVMGVLGFLLAIRKPYKQSDQYELELDSQRKSIEFQRKEIARLERLNVDQDKQIRDLLSRDAISPEEKATYATNKKEFDAMKAEVDKLAIYLRTYKMKEIAAGKHAGMSLSEVCIMYMGQSERVVN